jgi:peptidoglycan/LPS O-acetylase OafA/YrhL
MAFEPLDNGIKSCANPERLQRLADELTAEKIDRLLRKFLSIRCKRSVSNARTSSGGNIAPRGTRTFAIDSAVPARKWCSAPEATRVSASVAQLFSTADIGVKNQTMAGSHCCGGPVVILVPAREFAVTAPRVHPLDGLRAIAASLIVVFHVGGNALGPGLVASFISSATRSGVELFFVLSAVVLGRRYIREGRPLVAHTYFRRRAERLWPPYLVAWLLAGATIAVTSGWPTWWSVNASLPSFKMGEWLGQIFILNWWSPPYNFAWWSLTVEVSFYLLLPLLIPIFRAIHQQPALVFTAFLGTVLLSAIAFNRVDVPVIRDLVTYASCFAGGLVLASREVSAQASCAALLGGLCLTVGSTLFPSLNPHAGWGLFYFGIVATAMDRSSGLAKRLSSDTLVFLGERSYSLFLTHYSIIALTCWAVSMVVDSKGPTYFVATRLIAVPLSVLVAMMLFRYVERYFATGLVTGDLFWPRWPQMPRVIQRHSM